jgi:Flp pilus assembly protein TadD
LQKWLGDHPNELGAKVLLANTLLGQPDKSDAIATYERLVESDNVIVLNNLAWLYMPRGDGRALSTAKRAHALAPANPNIADTLGWILVQEGRPNEALTYLRQSVQLDPNNATAQYHLGVAYRETEDLTAARESLQRAVELGNFPDLEAAREALAQL